jgi:hypothetical protein
MSQPTEVVSLQQFEELQKQVAELQRQLSFANTPQAPLHRRRWLKGLVGGLVAGATLGVTAPIAGAKTTVSPDGDVKITSPSGLDVFSTTNGNTAIKGTGATAGNGVVGECSGQDAWGVLGVANGQNAIGVRGLVSGTGARAGYFIGNVQINGSISKTSGTFKIDHPLDPANKYLYHSFVESPDMKNIYDGIVTLDEAGEATVTLPDWFSALNRDLRYQLTPLGQSAPDIYIKQTVKDLRFVIAGGAPGQQICWQVTGNRQDAYALAYPVNVEEKKSERERGTYLHPEVHGQSPELAVHFLDKKK